MNSRTDGAGIVDADVWTIIMNFVYNYIYYYNIIL